MLCLRTNKKKESPMHRFLGMTSLAAISGAIMLAGCATVDDVNRAQATANQGVADAASAHMAADIADQKAERAGTIAMQAQATASSAQALATVANSSAQQAQADLRSAQTQLQAAINANSQRLARGERD